MNFISKFVFRVTRENCESRIVFLCVNWVWKLDLNWTNSVVFWDFAQIKLKVNESISWEKIDSRTVILIEFFETLYSFGNLEFVHFNEFNGLIFLLGDELSFSEDILFMRQELCHFLFCLFSDLLFCLFDFNFNRSDSLLDFFSRFVCLFLSHWFFYYTNLVVVDLWL